MNKKVTFNMNSILLKDVESVCNDIVNNIRNHVKGGFHREGAIVGISGGIDSSVTLALTVKALGQEKVTGIMLPEKDSDPESLRLAQKLADTFHVRTITENITGALEGFGCYKRRDEAVKRVFPEYNSHDYKMKIGIKQNPATLNLPPVFSIIIIDISKKEYSKILHVNDYLQIVASSNMKQRCRMTMLYYHAERLHRAVVGTANKHEIDQGFFVKNGDGGVDLMPISKLYKSQVYELAHYLNIPEEIIHRTPTTDTYSAEQSQEEFFYQMPFKKMDLLWYAFENSCPVEEVAQIMEMDDKEVCNIYLNFNRKQRTTNYLRMAPVHF